VDAEADASSAADAAVPTSDDGDGGTCKLSLPLGAACSACVGRSCCSVAEACMANAECVGVITCALGCGGDGGGGDLPHDGGRLGDGGGRDGDGGNSCLTACMKAHPGGAQQATAAFACAAISCAGSCAF
jgi:hypothetical protein